MTRQVRRRAIAVTVSTMLAAAVVGTASVAVADDFHPDGHRATTDQKKKDLDRKHDDRRFDDKKHDDRRFDDKKHDDRKHDDKKDDDKKDDRRKFDDKVDDGQKLVQTRLSGYEEDPLTISTTGSGTFRAKIDEKKKEIEYELSYEDLESPVTQAHIHFGGKRQSGNIIVFLCSNLGNAPAGTQNCPPAGGTVSGTLRPDDVIGPVNQGIAPGEFDEFLAAIRAGVTYVNVHSETYPDGEIRGQLDDDHHR